MNREDMLARLIAQAGDEGTDLVTLRAIVEEASDLGAARVLTRMGLADEDAHTDLAELRQLLSASLPFFVVESLRHRNRKLEYDIESA